MAPTMSFWTRVTYFFNYLSGSPDLFSTADGSVQIPLQGGTRVQPIAPASTGYPIYDPPDELQPLPFQCEYPKYLAKDGWISCNTNTDRRCWLKNIKTNQTFDITTDYENNGPTGIDRYYTLEIDYSTLNPDLNVPVPVQLFNGSFPGPRLQACWGDRIHITIVNKLERDLAQGHMGNGTTIHWHGFRQLNTFPMDGVNAITQCPIAPGQQFTYVFNATQYGTSWYHSHYSLQASTFHWYCHQNLGAKLICNIQYAAGALGAFTIYGPMSTNFDHQLEPIIMSDWLHESVFTRWERNLVPAKRTLVDNILQSGIGHWPPLKTSPTGDLIIPKGTRFNEVRFQKGVKYLMRLINGAADTTFVFSIDNHNFKVVSMDFVSIEPYETDHLVVGIGQRFNIIVEANPVEFTGSQNFWIRTTPSPNCTAFNSTLPSPDDHTGIVRYSDSELYPSSHRNKFEPTCADETYFRNLTPVVPWRINEQKLYRMEPFYLTFQQKQDAPYYPCKASEPTSHFELVPNNPMWLNFSDPTSLNLNQDFSKKPWLAEVSTKDVDEDEWIMLTIISGAKRPNNPLKPHPVPKKPGAYVPGQHPIHLHGHDFAVLDQCVPTGDEGCDVEKATPQWDNPPRRDVAFLPDNGYLLIAFKADNPGIWIMHCHIAFHASMGLATQILENRNRIKLPFGWDEPFEDMCKAWDKSGLLNSSDPCGKAIIPVTPLQTDSGI